MEVHQLLQMRQSGGRWWYGDLGGCGCVGTEALWESSVLFTQFCHEPKNALKNEVYKKIIY